jgi:UDP-glucose 4-epimerase
MKNKNILVTGGLGFIGSHIVDELIENNSVIIIDNKSTGKIENLKTPDHPNLTILEKDINDIDLENVLSDIDYVFHLAAMASVPLSIDNPIECNKVNVDATIKLLNACKINNVKKIVFSSSAAVYGDNKNLPIKETEPLLPNSPYAASKACCELYLKAFYNSYSMNYTILRYFNVFGPKQDKNSQYAAVIPNFISSLLEEKQPIIYGDGEQTRDFVFIKDVVDANIAACESNFNGVVNVASGKEITINELYKVICEILEMDVDIKYLPARKGDIKHSVADVTNLKKINCEIDFNEFNNQLKQTVQWFEKIL